MKRYQKFLLIAAGVIAVLLVVHTIFSNNARDAFAKEIDELEKAGEPVRVEDLFCGEIAAEENAAPIVLDLIAWLDKNASEEPEVLSDEGWQSSDEKTARVREHLLEMAVFLERLEPLRAKTGCRFDPEDCFKPMPFPRDWLAFQVRSNRLLCARAELRLRGNADEHAGAIQDLTLALAIARQLPTGANQEETVVLQTAAAQVCRLLERVIGRENVPVRELRTELDPSLRDAAADSRLVKTLRGDRTIIASLVMQKFLIEPSFQTWLLRPWLLAHASDYLDWWGKNFEHLTPPFPEYVKSRGELSQSAPSSPLMGFSLFGYIDNWREFSYESNRALIQLARVALALHIQRLETGRTPESLDEIAALFEDGVPLDPFTGQPFRYVKEEEGWKLSSSGPTREIPGEDAPKLDPLMWSLPP